MRVGILGGTGPAGRGLALRLAANGYDVVVGSRSKERADEVVAEMLGGWPGRDLPVVGGDNLAAATTDLVVLATPWEGAVDTARALSEHLEGKVVVSMVNALRKVGKQFEAVVLPTQSMAVAVQEALPATPVAAAFHHLPAKELGQIDEPMEGDVLVCASEPAATEATFDLVARMPDLRALDAGNLAAAAPIEAFTAVLLQLNVRYKTRAALKVTGVEA